MRRAWRIVRWLGAGIVLIVLALVGFSWFNLGRSFPQVEGRLAIVGLDGMVEIVRDVDGVPHIYADTAHDLFFAQGYVEAQDRFWQMDVFRHVGKGTLSEMFGRSTLDSDRFLRTLGWRDLPKQDLDLLSAPTRAHLRSYAAGVNAYTGDKSGGRLSFEHYVLSIIARSYEPMAWTPTDSLGFTRVMAWDLAGNLQEEIERSMLAGSMPVEQVEELYPSHPDEFPTIVPSGPASLTTTRALQVVTGAVRRAGGSLALDRLPRPADPGVGSNNWAISGSLTATGHPLLANDPHLAIRMPSIWYEVGLHCRTVTPECPYEVTGFTFAGVPGVIIGHNAHIAWGFTNLDPDGMDLYVEKLHPDDPNRYEYQGEWVEMEVHTETIAVAGGDPETLVVRATLHGPIIGDTYGALEDFDDAGVELPDHYAVALAWTALQPSTILDAILGIDRASDGTGFVEATRRWDIAGQNAVYATRDGTVGYRATGRVPIRSRGDGRWPVPGWTGEYEWVGWIPFEDMPDLVDPARGYVATANQPAVGNDYPYLVHTDTRYGYRAHRIAQLVEGAPGPIDAEYMRSMQIDAYNPAGPIVIPAVLALPTTSEEIALAQELLADWSQDAGDAHSHAYQMRSGLPGAALFGSLWRHLLGSTFLDDLPEQVQLGAGGRWFRVVDGLLAQPRSKWWDDSTTTEVETRDDILAGAVVAAVEELGPNPDRWDWEEMHTARFEEPTLGGLPLLGMILNSGEQPVAGGSSIIYATWWDPNDDSYDALGVPTMRMVVDLGDLSASTAINSTGQSGRPTHPHYDDMIVRWARNEQHPMRWSRTDVGGAAASTLVLVPATDQ